MTVSKRIPPAKVRRLWSDLSMPLDEAARQLGVSRPGLTYIARQLGLPSRAGNYAPQKKGCDEEFVRMWRAGVSLQDLADHFGYASHRGVCHRRKALGLPTRTRATGKGRRWEETISLTEWREQQLAGKLAASAAQTKAAIKDADMKDIIVGRRVTR